MKQALVILPVAFLVSLASAWCIGISGAARVAQEFLYSNKEVKAQAGEVLESNALFMIRGFRMSLGGWTTTARLRMKVRGKTGAVDAAVVLERRADSWVVEQAFIMDHSDRQHQIATTDIDGGSL